MTDCAVTVLCSTYNSAKWIEGYLDCINAQILKNFNIVFVDANSTDDSLSTIKQYKFREGIGVEIIECSDRIPIYTAWNMAIEKATTPYVININTDDRLYPSGLLLYLNYAERNPDADILFGGYLTVSDENHTQVVGITTPPEHSHEALLYGCYCGPFPLLKRSTIIEDGMFDPKYTISGDYEMWLRMSKKGRNFLRINQPMGSYYWNPTGMSTNQEHYNEHLRQNREFRAIHA